MKKTALSRRQILKTTCAASLALHFLPQKLLANEKEVIKHNIPSTGELLSIIGLGTSGTFESADSPEVQSALLGVLKSFFSHAGQLIDSSPMYGNAESVVGDLLSKIQNKENLFAATKVWTSGRESGIKQMNESIRRMGVERMDLMQIHNLRDWKVHLQTLREWKEQGKIRYIGITTSHGRFHNDFINIMQNEPLDFVQFSYNIEDRTAEKRIFPIAAEKGIATLINRPFQRGSLFAKVNNRPLPEWSQEFDCASWGQFFLKFIASYPGATCIIPATSKLKHMVDNMTAGYGRLPDQETRSRMIRYIESI